MRRFVPVLAVVAAGIAALTVQDAFAGNTTSILPLGPGMGPIRSWVSLKFSPGQRITFATSPDPLLLLVDDITYSVDVRPWEGGAGSGTPRQACFGHLDMWSVLESKGTLFPPPWVPPFLGNVFIVFNWGTITLPGGGPIFFNVTTWSGAKGDWHALELNNRFLFPPPTAPFDTFFDRISHTSNGQLNGREVWWDDETPPRRLLATSITIAQSIVNTSESRHYQTPHICLPGTEIVAQTPTNASPYNNATIYIKGRVITASMPLPGVNTDASVSAQKVFP